MTTCTKQKGPTHRRPTRALGRHRLAGVRRSAHAAVWAPALDGDELFAAGDFKHSASGVPISYFGRLTLPTVLTAESTLRVSAPSVLTEMLPSKLESSK